MILNISIKNFRSFKDEVTFSMVAESSKSKDQNVFVQSLAKGDDSVRLLNTALIYGANASGKSNLLRALFDIISFITKVQPSAGESIAQYDPFHFDLSTMFNPVEFFIEFVGKDNVKYRYELHFNAVVIKEELTYWPNKKQTTLFSRIPSVDKESLIHIGELGSSLGGDKIELFKNQTVLSKFGTSIPNDIISKVFIYLNKINIINSFGPVMMQNAKREVNSKMTSDNDFAKKVNELMKFADTGLEGISVTKIDESIFRFPEGFPELEKKKIIESEKFSMNGIHKMYNADELVNNDYYFPFIEESNGTQVLHTIGGKILEVIDNGDILFIDELETSFHPYLSKLLICLFQNKRINTKNAQLIFTTHDTNLLDSTLFRKDQVWFAEKNEYGATELYSLQDFSEVREDTPFEKWYLAGKFGGVPNIKSLESLFISQ